MKGGLPLAVALGGMLLYRHMRNSTNNNLAARQGQQDFDRAVEADRNAGTLASLRGGASLSPLADMAYRRELVDNGMPDDYPFEGIDKGAAAHARAAGAVLAKLGGIGSLISPGLKTKALVGGALVGGGLLAAKAGKKAYEYGMEPAQDRRLGPPGPRLPRYVNQWGVPTL